MIGRVLAGRYQISASLGDGGMARVWRAQDQNTGKTVAVKVLRDEYREDELFVRRFEREALAASRMTHPNIVNLLDVGVEEDGTRYLVIEFVSGKTLKQFIHESGALRPETAAQIIIRVLAAVQHAHQNGVIHRDIKPQNILIDKEGTVKVADFGIARVANTQTMSQDTDMVMGSVYYFSPEQARGAAVDEKSDLYSVGVVFYEMLTGQVPFTGDAPVAIAMKHIQEAPVAPSSVNPAVSPAMDFVVLHAMEKRPRNRYATAADMLRDIRLALEHPDTILAARAETERREREVRAAQRQRQQVQKRITWLRRALVGLFATLLLGVMALAGFILTERMLAARRNTVEVPNVIGYKESTAVPLLEELGLDPEVVYEEYTLVPEDVVADQSIVPGTFAAPGDIVTLTVCRSQYEVMIPNVVAMPADQAHRIIADAGLVVGENRIVVNPAQPGTVVDQAPKAGAPANRGDAVILSISAGSVRMPKIVGMPQMNAEQTILAYGLVLGDISERTVDDPAEVGVIVGQIPEAYAEVRPGTSVTLEIGVPSASLYVADVTLDLTDLPQGAIVTVTVANETGGGETLQYTSVFPDGGGPIAIMLYSQIARRTIYSVYYDGVLQYSEQVVFAR